jgi:hypothetical protein
VRLRERSFRLVQRGLWKLGAQPHADLNRCVIVELTTPPPATRSMRDLEVRRGRESDAAAACALDRTPPDLYRARLARGDMVYLGLLDGAVLCHTWLHPGPAPMVEERLIFTTWKLDAATFWSYHAVARHDVRTAGVTAKLFEVALREVFQTHRAERVQGFIHDTNQPSLDMHRRLGFVELGVVTSLVLPVPPRPRKWLRWRGAGKIRNWWLPADGEHELALPPS